MKKIIVLIAINILLLGIAYQVTNEDAVLTKKLLEIGKTYINKNDKNNKIVLYADYSVEIINCKSDDCNSLIGTFSIEKNNLTIITDVIELDFVIKDKNCFGNKKSIYILE